MVEFGVHPMVAVFFLIIGGVFFSEMLFAKTKYAVYIFDVIVLSLLIKNNETERNQFLKLTFTKRDYYTIRGIENLMTIVPFVVFLAVKCEFISIIGLILIGVALLFFTNYRKASVTIPTPFFRYPFEFVVGFRQWILGLLVSYFLLIMSIRHQNFNLAIVSLGLIFLICILFYIEVETNFYVWVHRQKAVSFLGSKIKYSFCFTSVLILPSVLCIAYFFNSELRNLGVVVVLGYVYLMTMVLAKYSNYPSQLNAIQMILFVMSMTMPPFLLIIIPYFYTRSVRNLKLILP